MKKMFCTLAVLASLVFVTACQQQTGMGTKETVGTAGGAVLGGVLGSRVGKGSGAMWATGVGTLLGAYMGNSIGSSLDKADMGYARTAEQRALTSNIGEEIKWNNPQSSNSGTVKAVRDGYSQSGRYCREYQHSVKIGGKTETAYGTACQQPNGDWEIAD